MTPEQKKWLDEHPDYTIVGRGGMSSLGAAPLPQGEHHVGMGALRSDGTFVPRVRAVPPAILVGKRRPDHLKG